MAKREIRIVRDGLFSCLGGMDSGRSPSLIDPDQIAYARNVTMRGGFPRTRPGFPQHELTFENDEHQDWFEDHQIQGGYTYRSKNSDNFLVVVAGGRFFKIEPLKEFEVTEVTPTKATATSLNFTAPAIGASVAITVDDASAIFVGYPIMVNGFRYMVTAVNGNVVTATNLDDPTAGLVTAPVPVTYLDPGSLTLRRVWFEQARQWLIAQNGQDAAALFDGSTMRRAVLTGDAPEVPTGTVMAYTNNRLWVATPGDQVAAGDIAGGPTDVIVFSEELGISGPARFQFDDEITAIVKTVTLDTSMGQGPLQVFTRNSCGSINVPASRSLWSQLNYAIQTVSLNHAGAMSQYAALQVNSDIHYRSYDGWRSFIMARREQSEWGNTPISGEMQRVLDDDDQSLLEYSSAVLLDNRVIFTVNPHISDNGIYHDGMAVLDFHLISRMGQKSRPVWDGFWNGISPTLLVQGEFAKVKRAFVFALDDDDKNVLYEIDQNATADDDDAITARLELRSFNFANTTDRKKLWGCELWIDEVRGTVNFDLNWRPDQSPCEFDWGEKSICSLAEDCEQDTEECKTLLCYRPGYRTRLGFGQPPDDDCDAQNLTPARMGYEHQLILEWEGSCRIKKLLAKSLIDEEAPDPPCDDSDDCRTQCGVFNEAQTFTAECPEGETGDAITVTIPAGRYAAETLEAANALALAVAQANAEAELECCEDTSNLIAGNLNSAVYDSVRDVIWGTGTPGHILKFDPDTGELISNTFVFQPDWSNDGTIAYCPETDRLYTSVRATFRDSTKPADKKLYEINPDTLAITNSILLSAYDSTFANFNCGFLRTYSFNGQLCFIAVDDNGALDVYVVDPSNLPTVNNSGLSSLAPFGDVAGDNYIDDTIIAVNNESGFIFRYAMDLSNYVGTDDTGRKLYGVAWCSWNKRPYAVCARQFVVKARFDSSSFTEIDLGRPNAEPYNIRYNPYTHYIYVPLWTDNTVAIISPVDDSFTIVSGFDSPYDIVCTPTKTFAVQHSRQGLKEVVASLATLPPIPVDPPDPAMVKQLISYYKFDEAIPGPWLDSKGTNHLTATTGPVYGGAVNAIAIQADNNIVIGGAFTTVNTTARTRMARIDYDHATVGLDSTFNPATVPGTVRAIAIQADTAIVAGGTTSNRLVRMSSAGVNDGAFAPAPNSDVRALAIQSGDQRIIVGGAFTSIAGRTIRGLERLNTDGTDDVAWNVGGNGLDNNSVFALAIDGSGNIIIGGSFTSYHDATNGSTAINRIARILSTGVLDTTFNPGTGANSDVNAIAIQSNGKILIGGAFTTFNGSAVNRIVRLNTDGTVDGTFTAPSDIAATVNALALQSDGKVIVGFSTTRRLTSTGALDALNNSSHGTVQAIVIQADGKIITGHTGTSVNTLFRLDPAHATILFDDRSFNPGAGPNSVNAGLNGNAVRFQDSSITFGHQIGKPDASIYLDPRKGFTITFWARVPATSIFQPIMLTVNGLTGTINGSSGVHDFSFQSTTGIPAFYGDGQYYSDLLTFAMTTNVWYFFRIWVDPTTDRKLRLQVTPDTAGTLNGAVQVTPGTFDKVNAFSSSFLRIGGSVTPSHTVDIDEMAIYEGALSDAEAAVLYGGGTPPTYPAVPYP